MALERMRLVDTVLFDKTGTLTKGTHGGDGRGHGNRNQRA